MEDTKSSDEKIQCFGTEIFQRKAPFNTVLNKVLRIEREDFVFTLDTENPLDQKFQNPSQIVSDVFQQFHLPHMVSRQGLI